MICNTTLSGLYSYSQIKKSVESLNFLVLYKPTMTQKLLDKRVHSEVGEGGGGGRERKTGYEEKKKN